MAELYCKDCYWFCDFLKNQLLGICDRDGEATTSSTPACDMFDNNNDIEDSH